MKVRGFITHKVAECFKDCADYFKINRETKRIAVSDGVSQSIMPLEWAKILTNAYTDDGWELVDEIAPLQKKWEDEARTFLESEKKKGKNPWLLENSLNEHQGAGATICGISFGENGKWRASILGDTCFVKVDEEGKISEIISSKDGAFDNRPDYFDSYLEKRGTVKFVEGVLQDSEKILLVSDPFSELFQKVKETDINQLVVKSLLDVHTFNGYERVVDSLRNLLHMHNDDSTLIIIEPDQCDDFTIEFQKTLDELIKDESLKEESAKVQKIQKLKDKTEQENWDKALAVNTVDSYKTFLKLYPDSKHASIAMAFIAIVEKSSVPTKNEKGSSLTESSEEADDSVRCELGQEQTNDSNTKLLEQVDSQNSSGEGGTEEQEQVSKNTFKETDGEENKSFDAVKSEEKSDSDISGPERKSVGGKRGNSCEGKSSDKRTEKCENDTHEVALMTAENSLDNLSVPEDVDSSDGIDSKEFMRFEETATSLFRKFDSKFEPLFAMYKWKNDRTDKINKCFSEFWRELERIMYSKNNNG